jgi:hypothetical protein
MSWALSIGKAVKNEVFLMARYKYSLLKMDIDFSTIYGDTQAWMKF